jgi:hypothetical protein
MTDTTYPVDYGKGDEVRQAHSRKDETKLKFDGFRPLSPAATVPHVIDEPDHREPSYAALQEQAKALQELGYAVPANLPYEDLLAAVTDAAADRAKIEANA